MSNLGILRSIDDDELELMREWRNAPAVRANMYTQHEISHDEHLAWWAKARVRTDQKYFMYSIADVPTGIAAFTHVDTQSQNATWAFYASPIAPKGTGGKMEFLMLEYAFGTLQLHKLCCEVLAFNTSVIKMHQKFGFNIEGVFKAQYKSDNGFVDIYRLGIFATEWQQKRQEMHEKLTAQIRA
jgi:UDP-4-amino-4,6-dideoxy-N-acetyl-beta-L-altrosamine N-acetyltransferase